MNKKIIPPTKKIGRYVLAIDEYLKAKSINPYRASVLCDLSAPTMYKMVRGKQRGLDAETLAKLRNGIGATLTDIWKWVEE
jgi:hypothetical protein